MERRHRILHPVWRLCRLVLVSACLGLAAAPLCAQVPDTTAVAPPDTTALARPERVAARPAPGPPAGYAEPELGLPVGTVRPVKTPALDAPALLADVPATFVYDFGAVGWPDGWSPFGLAPYHVALRLDGLPLDDLVTGGARYDHLPLAFLEPLGWTTARDDAPVAVLATFRPYDVPNPLTEVRYRTSNQGLQSVAVSHAQRRRTTLFGRPARFNVLFGYGGHAARNEYPGSRLRRGRQLLGRFRIEQTRWSFELRDLVNRGRIGAHGGVIPVAGLPYESIFRRIDAQVNGENARRETIRNDLSATLRLRVLPVPLTLTGFWTTERFQYLNPPDTLTARMRRLGLRFTQAVALPGNRLRLRAELWHDAVRHGDALPDSLGLTRDQLHLSARDDLRLGPFDAVLEGGLHRDGDVSFLTGLARLGLGFGPDVRVFGEASRGGQPVSWIAREGFGGLVRPLGRRVDGRVMQVRGGAEGRVGPLRLSVVGFAHEVRRPVEVFATAAADTVAFRRLAPALRRVGVSAEIGLRQDAARGFYLTVTPSFVRFVNFDASADHARVAASLPELFAHGRLGARLVLFQGDLDLDVYLYGRYWSETVSRVLHPQTGLLTIPETGARSVGPSGLLSLYIEAGVRTATLFLSYENMLSGTQLQTGNLLIPDYPLPERHLRFGVFWPIEN